MNPTSTRTATLNFPAERVLGTLTGDGPPPLGVRYECNPRVRVEVLHAGPSVPATIVWSFTPGTVMFEDNAANESGYVISGRARVVDTHAGQDGAVRELGPGDVFVLPSGGRGDGDPRDGAQGHRRRLTSLAPRAG